MNHNINVDKREKKYLFVPVEMFDLLHLLIIFLYKTLTKKEDR